MTNNKKFIKIFFSLSLLFLSIVALFNFIIDPYQQYRKPTLYKTFYGGNQRALNTGLAKNHNYNSVVIGSSMTENFLISKVSEIINNPIKLSISGGSAHEIFNTLNTVFKSNNNIETVLIGLDIYAVSGKIDRLRYGDNSLPLYLYDYNYLNDIFYLINFDTLKEFVKVITLPIIKKNDLNWNYENMYQWQDKAENEFGKENVLKILKESPIDNNKFDKNEYSFETLKKSFDYNFLALVKSNPNKNFIFFYPPYSIIAFKDWTEKDILFDIMKFKLYVNEEFSNLKNVILYDFQSAIEITTNLDNYKDFSHYHQNINHWMIEQIKENNYLVTKDNIDEHLENIRKQIEEYDLNKLGLD